MKIIPSIVSAAVMTQAFELSEKEMKSARDNLNILILGKTGVGKSTLINTVFGKNVAKTGSGRPITQEIRKYKVDDDFSIFDTKGLELKDFSNIKGDIENFLDKKSGKTPHEQIHIAWLCIAETSRRVEDGERELWGLLQKYHIPSMLVITKATQDMDENGVKFSDFIKKDFKIKNERHIQRVVALAVKDDEGNESKVKGVENLVQKTYNLQPEALKNAFARKQNFDKELQIKAKTDEARKIINRYAVAAGNAFKFLSVADAVLLFPTQIAMIVHISKIYGLELSLDSAKKLAVSFSVVASAGFMDRFKNAFSWRNIFRLNNINDKISIRTTKLMGEVYIAYLNDNFDKLSKALQNINKGVVETYFDKVKMS